MTSGFNFNNNGKETLSRYDARTERTQYGNLHRSLCRSLARVAREGEDVSERISRCDRRQNERNCELGKRHQYADLGQVAFDCRRSQNVGAQSFAERVELSFYRKTDTFYLTGCRNSDITNSVESDGVRLNFLTARVGAAFSTVRDVVVGRFSCPLLSVESVGRLRSFSDVANRRTEARSPPSS